VKKTTTIGLGLGWVACALLVAVPAAAQKTTPAEMTAATFECLECHSGQSAGIYQEWGSSKHFRGNIGCYECHRAEAGEADAFEHNGHTISIIVSPRDCSRCHAKEVREFDEITMPRRV
jgi:formate-dependent nitrite reductase cytochrome c552 subunit